MRGYKMREIKFRAWNVLENKMIPWEEMWSILGVTSITTYEHQHDSIGKTKPLYIPMQYTGLKDKNGKEIYEGDILYGNEDENDTVVYEENKFILQPLGDDSIFWEKSEVIGNIYENKELLND